VRGGQSQFGSPQGSSSIIHSLGQPFYVKLDATEMSMAYNASDHCRDFTFLQFVLLHDRRSGRYVKPFSGK